MPEKICFFASFKAILSKAQLLAKIMFFGKKIRRMFHRKWNERFVRWPFSLFKDRYRSLGQNCPKSDATVKLFSDGLSELNFIECGENGPYDMNAPKVHTLGKVQKVSITDCSWGKTILYHRRDDLWIILYGLL